jgi:DNA-binding transcriptional LysR family regulator
MARLHAAEADLSAFRAGASGSLRVGTYQSVGQHILPGLMQRFTAQWPQVEVRLTERSDDHELFPMVERGELDLAFGIYPLLDGPFEAQELLADPYVLIVKADSPLARRGRLFRFDEIAGEPLISYRQCRGTIDVEAQLATRGFTPNVVFRSDDNGTIQALVAAGMGAALVPRLVIEPDDPGIAVVEIGDLLPPRRVVLVWHRDRYRSPAARAFAECAATICRELADAANDQRQAG